MAHKEDYVANFLIDARRGTYVPLFEYEAIAIANEIERLQKQVKDLTTMPGDEEVAEAAAWFLSGDYPRGLEYDHGKVLARALTATRAELAKARSDNDSLGRSNDHFRIARQEQQTLRESAEKALAEARARDIEAGLLASTIVQNLTLIVADVQRKCDELRAENTVLRIEAEGARELFDEAKALRSRIAEMEKKA